VNVWLVVRFLAYSFVPPDFLCWPLNRASAIHDPLRDFSHPSAVPVGGEGRQGQGTLVVDCYIHRDNQSGSVAAALEPHDLLSPVLNMLKVGSGTVGSVEALY
jgi:hypothetical protein